MVIVAAKSPNAKRLIERSSSAHRCALGGDPSRALLQPAEPFIVRTATRPKPPALRHSVGKPSIVAKRHFAPTKDTRWPMLDEVFEDASRDGGAKILGSGNAPAKRKAPNGFRVGRDERAN
jgi:hypothetical protein